MTFKVVESGWYRTRDGRLAVVMSCPFETQDTLVGFVYDLGWHAVWDYEGQHSPDIGGIRNSNLDLVEYLGKERPKEKKVVRMAPALCRHHEGTFYVSTLLFASEHKAKSLSDFVRWLIDSHGIEVEVPDNG